MVKQYKMLINGEFVGDGERLDVLNPYDGEVVGTTWRAGPEDLERATKAAVAAFPVLRQLATHERAAMIRKVAEGIGGRREELARLIAKEAAKPITDARVEVGRAINTFQLAAEETTRLGGEVFDMDVSAGLEGRFAVVRRFPIGPVLGITPFNFPLNLVSHKVAPAMASANPIIIKPASKTPLTALVLGEIVTAAGWPPGGLSVVVCGGEAAEKLASDDRIKKLSFTGSATVGWRLKALAGRARVTLELGGNAGVVVDEGTDLEYAAARCAFGAFSYAGQICISVQRILVDERVFEEFKTRLLSEARALESGDPLAEATRLGPMIEESAVTKTQSWVDEAVKQGAEVLTGGKGSGVFFEPTVLTGTTPEMKVCAEEVFAPVVTLERFRDFSAAIDELNLSRFGLQAGVFTLDMKKVMHAYETLDVGGVIINDIPTFRIDSMPYGGVKMSGMGREGVRYAIEEMTELKLLAVNIL